MPVLNNLLRLAQLGGNTADRQYFNDNDLDFLEQEYQRNPKWGKKDQLRISMALKTNKTKVYKWNWDKKLKIKNQK